MTTYTISAQDKKILELLAKGEANQGGDPYASMHPSTTIPEIVQMSIDNLQQLQWERYNNRNGSGAAGRYQFIPTTLKEMVEAAGIPFTTRFTPDVQDFLAITLLKKRAQYDSWKSGGISDQAMQLNIAKIWASVPVPYDVETSRGLVPKGGSYWSGVGGNKAVGHQNADVFTQELADIRGGGPGTLVTVDIQQGSAGVPAGGNYTTSQIEALAGGGQRPGTLHAGQVRRPNSTLPAANNPYQYNVIDPFDNRYDFRTGQKVRDIRYNGTQPVSTGAYIIPNGYNSGVDIGTLPVDPSILNAIKAREKSIQEKAAAEGISKPTQTVSPSTKPNVSQYGATVTPRGR